MGTQPSDLLMAWLSFLAGDFCELGKTNNVPVSFAVLLIAGTVYRSENSFTLLEVIYITRSRRCLLWEKWG